MANIPYFIANTPKNAGRCYKVLVYSKAGRWLR